MRHVSVLLGAWDLAKGMIQIIVTFYVVIIYIYIYTHYDQPNGWWWVNESWVCCSIMEFLIMKCYFAPSMLGTCVRSWKSSIIVCTEKIGIHTSFYVCAFSIFAWIFVVPTKFPTMFLKFPNVIPDMFPIAPQLPSLLLLWYI